MVATTWEKEDISLAPPQSTRPAPFTPAEGGTANYGDAQLPIITSDEALPLRPLLHIHQT